MAIQHVTRAARVFRQPGKHMQMVGVGGTGKATVAKLAAFIEDCAFLRPYVSRTYSLVEFRDDLKKGCLRAGVKGDNTVLFLTDNLIKVSLNDKLSRLTNLIFLTATKEDQMDAVGRSPSYLWSFSRFPSCIAVFEILVRFFYFTKL